MESDQILPHRRPSSHFPAGGCAPSLSCFPGHEETMDYSRILHLCDSHSGSSNSKNNENINSKRPCKRWRAFLRRLVRDGKMSLYGSKSPSFHYDAVSYLQNFDEGCHRYEESIRKYCCNNRSLSRSKMGFT